MIGRGMHFRGVAAVLAATALVAGVAACDGVEATPTGLATAIPTLPGTSGHFDNGEFSFDYPADWHALGGTVEESCYVIHVAAVIGVGAWELATNRPEPNGGVLCGLDSVTVPPGGIVVRIFWRSGGPAPMCQSPAPTANATLGQVEALKTAEGGITTWEFRWPDGQFFWPNNPTFEVHTSDPAQLAKAEAMVASFKWGVRAPMWGGLCSFARAS
jgi:hypothetical protein